MSYYISLCWSHLLDRYIITKWSIWSQECMDVEKAGKHDIVDMGAWVCVVMAGWGKAAEMEISSSQGFKFGNGRRDGHKPHTWNLSHVDEAKWTAIIDHMHASSLISSSVAVAVEVLWFFFWVHWLYFLMVLLHPTFGGITCIHYLGSWHWIDPSRVGHLFFLSKRVGHLGSWNWIDPSKVGTTESLLVLKQVVKTHLTTTVWWNDAMQWFKHWT